MVVMRRQKSTSVIGVCLVVAAAWVSTSIAVCVAIYLTGDARALYAMVIPALVEVSVETF